MWSVIKKIVLAMDKVLPIKGQEGLLHTLHHLKNKKTIEIYEH
jgi:hypothetical protein